MIKRTFVISDTHFGHDNVYKFTEKDNPEKRIRPWASSVQEGDLILKEKWNSTISKDDVVWFLGDFAWSTESLKIANELNGDKILVLGNHDKYPSNLLLKYFLELRGTFYHKGLIFSHFPVHPSSFGERFVGNVHGHTHHHQIIDDERYINVSVESPQRKLFNVEYGVPIELSTITNYYFRR
jgi:calcineurin-like phosphoesterase family protein